MLFCWFPFEITLSYEYKEGKDFHGRGGEGVKVGKGNGRVREIDRWIIKKRKRKRKR